MQLLWSKPIPCSNPWAPMLAGIFTRHDGLPVFFWKEEKRCAMLPSGTDAPVLYAPPIPGLSLPCSWYLLEEQSLLLLTDRYAVDLDCLRIVPHTYPLPRKEAYPSFMLGDYRIDYNGGHTLTCTRDGEPLWHFKIQAYLYTSITQCGSLILFGTSGNGGHFYILRLETGEVVTDIRTGGTIHFAQADGRCYVLTDAPKAKLLQLDVAAGRILEELPLPGKSADCSLRLMDGQVHAITYQFKSGRLTGAMWHCVDVHA